MIDRQAHADRGGERSGPRQPFADLWRESQFAILTGQLDAERPGVRIDARIAADVHAIDHFPVAPRAARRKLELELRLYVVIARDRRQRGIRLEHGHAAPEPARLAAR